MAILVSSRSKDPSTKVGAVIFDTKTNRVVSVGYNGFPRGVSDHADRWEDRPTKYKFVVHAELNSILSSKAQDLTGMSMVCTLEPCEECAKAIIQSGIKSVYWIESRENKYSRTMFTESGVKHGTI